MEETIAEKDVGVTIDNKLSFDKHITEKVDKANSIIGVIRRTFEYLGRILTSIFRTILSVLMFDLRMMSMSSECEYD
jgi:hypothetical protein